MRLTRVKISKKIAAMHHFVKGGSRLNTIKVTQENACAVGSSVDCRLVLVLRAA
jgi:hypothetical protein